VTDNLSLFPLAQPLFPGMSLDLQVFEQRYLRLVRESMRKNELFGIVAIAEGKEVGSSVTPHDVGVAVTISDWRQQSNGLLGITVSGERRFCVEATHVEGDGLIVAEVTWPELCEEEALPADQLEALDSLLRDLCQHHTMRWLELEDEISAVDLSWYLSQVLPISVEKKIELMAESDTGQRLRHIQVLVEQLSSI